MASSTSRRDFLKSSLLTSALFGAPHALHSDETRKANENRGEAKNVIMMVSDGMSHGALSLANHYRSRFEEKSTHWMQLYRERPVVRALMETWSANSIVTDSAAAASSWGGGARINNGALNIAPDGNPNKTLQQKLKEKAIMTGLVTTATFTHATPAGFAANIAQRSREADIAQQYLERGVDVLLGGGRNNCDKPLRDAYRAANYDLVRSRKELLELQHQTDRKLIGMFADSHMPFDIDRKNLPELQEQVPSLVEMAQAALARLDRDSNRFFLMIEGARIDHANHANDAIASIHDQLAFDDTIGFVLEYIATHPDTLLIITTDHGCGGMQLNGISSHPNQTFDPGIYNASSFAFEQIKGFKHSIEWMKQNKVHSLSGDPLREALQLHTGLKLNEDEVKRSQGLKSDYLQVIQNHYGIGWTSGNHTADLVEFCATGPGSQHFPGFIQNFEVHNKILSAFGIA